MISYKKDKPYVKVLLVDDDRNEHDLIAEFLSKSNIANFELLSSFDLNTAFQAIADNKPDIIILDLQLPEYSGLETLKTIKALFTSLPIIIYTGTISSQELALSAKYGADDFIIKGKDTLSSLDVRILNNINKHKINSVLRTDKFYKRIRDFILVILDVNGNVTLISKGAKEILGFDDDIIGKNWFDFIPEKERKNVMRVFQEIIEAKGKKYISYENAVLTKNGDERLIHWNNMPIKDSKQKIIGTISIGIDITDAKKMEQELIKKEKIYTHLINSINEIVIISDIDGYVVVSNIQDRNLGTKDFKHLTDYYSNLWEILLENKDKILKGEKLNFELKHGEKTFIVVVSQIYSDETIPYMGIIMFDISKEIKIQENLKKLLEEKNTLVKEMHHRIKNNLQLVSSLLYMQMKDIKDEGIKNKFMEARNRIQSISIIHEKLYQSAGKKNINISDYLMDIAVRTLNTFGKDDIKLEFKAKDIYISVDKAIPLGLIVNEIVVNSIKYAFGEATEGIISINVTEDDEYVNLIIADNGSGKVDYIKEHESMGITIIRSMASQINAILNMYDKDGVCYEIRIRKENI